MEGDEVGSSRIDGFRRGLNWGDEGVGVGRVGSALGRRIGALGGCRHCEGAVVSKAFRSCGQGSLLGVFEEQKTSIGLGLTLWEEIVGGEWWWRRRATVGAN